MTLLTAQKEIVHLTKEDVDKIVKEHLDALPTKLNKIGAPKEEQVKAPTQTELNAMSIGERAQHYASLVKN